MMQKLKYPSKNIQPKVSCVIPEILNCPELKDSKLHNKKGIGIIKDFNIIPNISFILDHLSVRIY